MDFSEHLTLPFSFGPRRITKLFFCATVKVYELFACFFFIFFIAKSFYNLFFIFFLIIVIRRNFKLPLLSTSISSRLFVFEKFYHKNEFIKTERKRRKYTKKEIKTHFVSTAISLFNLPSFLFLFLQVA